LKIDNSRTGDIRIEGITLSSRYAQGHELELLRAVIFDLSSEQRGKIDTLDCDSKSTASFLCRVKKWNDSEAAEIAAALENSLFNRLGGHNGIAVVSENRRDTLGKYHYRNGIWRDDVSIGGSMVLLDQLRDKWPAVFSSNDPQPLKVGIHNDILAALPGTNPAELRIALDFITRAEKYLRAIVARRPRRNLEGRKKGTVTPHQVDVAKRQLGMWVAP
jgi:hypothetical protein